MARLRVPLNNFSFGEVSPSLTSRTDSPVYASAAESIKNFVIRAEGGVINRAGLQRVYNFPQTYNASLQQQIKLEPFIFSDDEKYVVAFSNGQIDCFIIDPATGVLSHAQTITADTDGNALPIDDGNILQLTHTQKGDFMFICHREFLCRQLVRTGLTTFEVRLFEFEESLDGNRVYQPYYNFQPAGVTISSSAINGNIVTLTTSAAYFTAGHVGVRLLIGEAEAIISAYTSPTQVTAAIFGELSTQLDPDALKTKDGSNKIEVTHAQHGMQAGASVTIAEAGGLGGISASNINGARTINRIIDANHYEITAGASATSEVDGGGSPVIKSAAPTTEWYEQSYSTVRGFPQAVTFHEDRLWFGGTPSQPDGLWASRTGYYYNFDLGDAEDGDAIDLDANVGVTNEIRHLVSNRDLQVFSSQGEFYVPAFQDAPVTPAKAKLSIQTPVGSGYMRPQSVDGATLFTQATGTAVREYLYADAEGSYTSTTISLLSSHLVSNPVQLAVVQGALARPGAYGFFLMDNGELAIFHSLRSESRAGWMRWTTEGKFHSVCSTGEDVYVVTVRDDGSGTNKLFMEKFDVTKNMDFSNDFTGTAGVFSVAGHFADGATVEVVDGTEYLGAFTVASGQVDVSAVKPTSVAAQIGYKYTPEIRTLPFDAQVQGGPLTGEPRKITKVVLDLYQTLSVSVNGTALQLRTVTHSIGSGNTPVTGKQEFRVLGYSRDPRVTITQEAPLPLQINGMITEVSF
jgi:hypothetical protein